MKIQITIFLLGKVQLIVIGKVPLRLKFVMPLLVAIFGKQQTF
jgi:hypothetical protein